MARDCIPLSSTGSIFSNTDDPLSIAPAQTMTVYLRAMRLSGLTEPL